MHTWPSVLHKNLLRNRCLHWDPYFYVMQFFKIAFCIHELCLDIAELLQNKKHERWLLIDYFFSLAKMFMSNDCCSVFIGVWNHRGRWPILSLVHCTRASSFNTCSSVQSFSQVSASKDSHWVYFQVSFFAVYNPLSTEKWSLFKTLLYCARLSFYILNSYSTSIIQYFSMTNFC